MLTLLILANFIFSRYWKRFCSQTRMVMWYLAGFGCCFGFANAQLKPSGWALYIFVLSFCPAFNNNENDNETISSSWQNVLLWWRDQTWKDSWNDSLPSDLWAPWQALASENDKIFLFGTHFDRRPILNSSKLVHSIANTMRHLSRRQVASTQNHYKTQERLRNRRVAPRKKVKWINGVIACSVI